MAAIKQKWEYFESQLDKELENVREYPLFIPTSLVNMTLTNDF